MKKMLLCLTVSLASIFFLAGFAIADSDAWQEAEGFAGSSYFADSPDVASGWANAQVKNPVGFDYSMRNIAGAFSSQKASSEAFASGKRGEKEEVTINADVYQNSGAYVDHGNTWAYGQEQSGAGYDVTMTHPNQAGLEGKAYTEGGTFTSAIEISFRGTDTAISFAEVNSKGCASIDKMVDPYAWGEGEVGQATWVENDGGFAGTTGTASYSYDVEGRKDVQGSGMAITTGTSSVSITRYGVEANAASMSFSSTGSGATTSGGLQISNRNIN